jgi:hypothetical protein
MSPLIVWMMYLCVCIYNVLDAYHTSILFTFGIGEGNPLINYFIQQYPDAGVFWVIMSVKAIPLYILGVLLLIAHIQLLWKKGESK